MNPFWMAAADFRKTLLASLGVLVLLAIAFSATVTVSLFERSLREAGAVSAKDVDLVVGAPGSRLDLVLAAVYLRSDEVLPLAPYTLVDALRQDPRVALVSPLVFADHWNDSPIVGVGDDFPRLRPGLKLASGRWPQAPFETVAGASTVMTLGQDFYGSHGMARQRGTEEETHRAAAYHVVGTLARTGSPWDRALLTRYDSIWILHGELEEDATPEELDHVGRVSAVLVKPRDFASAYSLRAQYREGATTAAFPGEVLANLFGLFDSVKTALNLVSLLFQTLVFAAVLLSLLASLPSKVRWIGLLRALGAGPGYLFLTLWVQVALVFACAGLLGSAVGWAAARALALLVESGTGLTLSVGWTGTETALLAAFAAVGLLGALIPAAAGYRTSARRSLLGQS